MGLLIGKVVGVNDETAKVTDRGYLIAEDEGAHADTDGVPVDCRSVLNFH